MENLFSFSELVYCQGATNVYLSQISYMTRLMSLVIMNIAEKKQYRMGEEMYSWVFTSSVWVYIHKIRDRN